MKLWKSFFKSFRLLGDIWEAVPQYLPMEFVSICFSVLDSMVVRIYLVKVILDLVVSQNFEEAVTCVVLAAAADLVLCSFESWMDDYYRPLQAIRLHKYFHEKLYAKVGETDMEYFDNPEFYNRYVLAAQNIDSTAQKMIGSVRNFFITVAEIVIAGGMILSGMGNLLWLVVIPSTLYALLSVIRAKDRVGMTEDMNVPKKKMNYVRRMFMMREYALDIRTTGLKGLLLQMLDRSGQDALDAAKNRAGRMVLWYLLQGFLFYYQYVAIIVCLAWRALVVGNISVGEYSMLFSSAVALCNNWRFFGNTVSSLLEYGLFYDHYHSFLKQMESRKQERGKKIPETFQEVQVSDVSFRYTGQEKNVFSDLSLSLRKNRKIAVVGHNGAGKSTLVSMILAFYAPTEGKIFYNGEDVSEYDPKAYRAAYATIFQDGKLYPFSVEENLLFRRAANAEEKAAVWNVLRLVDLEDVVKELPRALDTPVTKTFENEGVIFSGGQQQRLLLARALLREAPVLILDEPTAAQDPRMESEMNQLFTGLKDDKAILLVSHRLTTVSGVDYIYLLDKTGIKEEGTHEDLMALNGDYARIYRKQAELYAMD